MEIQIRNPSLTPSGMETKLPGPNHHQPEEDRPFAPTGQIQKEEEEEPKPLRGGSSSSTPETAANQPKICQNCGKSYTTRYCNLKCLYYNGPLFPSMPYKRGDVNKEPESRRETRPETNPKPQSGAAHIFCEWYTQKDLDRKKEMMRKYPGLRA